MQKDLVFVLISGCLAGLGCAGAGAESRAENPTGGDVATVGKPMPSFSAPLLSGKGAVRLESYRGKVVLLDVWASWCAPCKEELPLLDDMQTKLQSKGIQIIALSIDEDREAAASFLSTRSKWALTVAHDPAGKVAEKLAPPKMPTSYLIDRKGVLRFVNAGFDRSDAARIEGQLLDLAAD